MLYTILHHCDQFIWYIILYSFTYTYYILYENIKINFSKWKWLMLVRNTLFIIFYNVLIKASSFLKCTIGSIPEFVKIDYEIVRKKTI